MLRPVLPGDVPGILSLISEVYGEYGCTLHAEAEERHLLEPGPFFRSGGGEFWVVEEEGAIRATVGVLLHPEAAELKSLYVHPSLRRRGWGRKLVDLALGHARKAGRRRFFLWSDTRFLDAHRLYRRLGLTEKGRRKLEDLNRSTELGFELELPPG